MDQLDLDHLSLEVAIILQPQECFPIMTHTLVMHPTMMDTIASKIYAFSDGGADACVVGTNAYIAGETGRYAHLIGYDPATTKSHRIPIVTAYLKVKAHNGVPVLLKINEAAYNAGSPITLLSE